MTTRPRAALVAVLWCTLVAAVLLFAPLSTTRSTVTTSDGTRVATRTTHESLVEQEGGAVGAVLAVPALVALGGWFAARRAWRAGVVVAAAVLAAAVFAGLLSIGLFFVPAAVAMYVATGGRRHTATAVG